VWCVCVLFVHLLEDDLRCLFNPHQVNHGGVQKPPTQVSLPYSFGHSSSSFLKGKTKKWRKEKIEEKFQKNKKVIKFSV
jgi:hypothetical protein